MCASEEASGSRTTQLIVLLLALLSILSFPFVSATSLSAQSIRGIVLASITRRPVEGAIVSLFDSTAEIIAIVRTSDRGRFRPNWQG